MEHTREKFNEAEYFVDRMREIADNGDVFRYHLSAFLSAARSITFIIDREYKHHSQHGDIFVKWYGDTSDNGTIPGTKQDEMKNDELFRFFRETRNYIIKQGQPKTESEVIITNESDTSQRLEIHHPDGTTSSTWIPGGASSTIQSPSQAGPNDITIWQVIQPEPNSIDVKNQHYFYDTPDLDLEVPEICKTTPISQVAELYLEKLERNVLAEWEQYLAGEITPEDLLETKC